MKKPIKCHHLGRSIILLGTQKESFPWMGPPPRGHHIIAQGHIYKPKMSFTLFDRYTSYIQRTSYSFSDVGGGALSCFTGALNIIF